MSGAEVHWVPEGDARGLLTAIVTSTDDAMFARTLEGTITSWNPAAERLFGYTAGDIVGKSMELLIPPDRASEYADILGAVRRGERLEHRDTVRRRRDGSLVDVSLTIAPIRDAAGGLVGASTIARDITEGKRLQREVAMREQQLAGFFAGATAGLAIMDRQFRYVHINEALAESNGRPASAHIGNTVATMLPELASVIMPLLERVLATGEPILDVPHSGATPREPGCVRHWMGSYFPIHDASGSVESIGAIVIDLTAHKQAEEALRESEERFRQLAEYITEVFWITDPEKQTILYVSPAYEAIWGRTRESLYRSPLNWLDAIHPQDRKRILDAATTRQATGEYDEVYRIVRPGGDVRWIHDRAFPIRDAEGRVYRIVGTAEDVTERHQLEEQYRHAQKMEAIGTLAGGIAHDFNNILTAINGYTQLAQRMSKEPDVRECLVEVEHAGARATDLVRQILTFSRQHEQARHPIQLRHVVAESLKLLRATMPSTIEFDIALPNNIPIVLAEVSQVHQVLMNLGTNSAHAMRDRPGRLEVRLTEVVVDAYMAETHPKLRPGRYVRLVMSDNGHGMEPATQDRMFEPFFTTKGMGEGTGLGLAAVHGIMESHQGAILVFSRPNEGTAIHLYFPAHDHVTLPAPVEPAAAPTGHGERVLLIDDEAPIVRLGVRMLERLGYATVSTTDVEQAIEIVRDDPAVALVITDLTMPGMTGLELAKRLLELRPELPIVITTGYMASHTLERLRALGIRDLLLKPHTFESLGNLVHRVLSGESAQEERRS